jgi:hypothetical protein
MHFFTVENSLKVSTLKVFVVGQNYAWSAIRDIFGIFILGLPLTKQK